MTIKEATMYPKWQSVTACPKCGQERPKYGYVQYVTATQVGAQINDGPLEIRDVPECIEITCRKCRHVWREHPADAEEAQVFFTPEQLRARCFAELHRRVDALDRSSTFACAQRGTISERLGVLEQTNRDWKLVRGRVGQLENSVVASNRAFDDRLAVLEGHPWNRKGAGDVDWKEGWWRCARCGATSKVLWDGVRGAHCGCGGQTWTWIDQ